MPMSAQVDEGELRGAHALHCFTLLHRLPVPQTNLPETEEGNSCFQLLHGLIAKCCRYDVSEVVAFLGTLVGSGASQAPWRALLEATSNSAAFEAHLPCALCSSFIVAAELPSDFTLQSQETPPRHCTSCKLPG